MTDNFFPIIFFYLSSTEDQTFTRAEQKLEERNNIYLVPVVEMTVRVLFGAHA